MVSWAASLSEEAEPALKVYLPMASISRRRRSTSPVNAEIGLIMTYVVKCCFVSRHVLVVAIKVVTGRGDCPLTS